MTQKNTVPDDLISPTRRSSRIKPRSPVPSSQPTPNWQGPLRERTPCNGAPPGPSRVVLLLGAESAGKSTIFKQFQILYDGGLLTEQQCGTVRSVTDCMIPFIQNLINQIGEEWWP